MSASLFTWRVCEPREAVVLLQLAQLYAVLGTSVQGPVTHQGWGRDGAKERDGAPPILEPFFLGFGCALEIRGFDPWPTGVFNQGTLTLRCFLFASRLLPLQCSGPTKEHPLGAIGRSGSREWERTYMDFTQLTLAQVKDLFFSAGAQSSPYIFNMEPKKGFQKQIPQRVIRLQTLKQVIKP